MGVGESRHSRSGHQNATLCHHGGLRDENEDDKETVERSKSTKRERKDNRVIGRGSGEDELELWEKENRIGRKIFTGSGFGYNEEVARRERGSCILRGPRSTLRIL